MAGDTSARDEFHPALPGKTTNCPRKIGIVSTSVVTSAPRSERNRALVEQLLEKRFSCVIWDEAHRIRRGNLSPNNVYSPPEKKLLYKFAEQLAARTKTLLLATATPVQLHPMEPWDLRKSYEEQLDLLISRGLVVTDRPKALEYLQRIGYYRLSGYWYPFRERSGPHWCCLVSAGVSRPGPGKAETIALDDCMAGGIFENAVKLYVFDSSCGFWSRTRWSVSRSRCGWIFHTLWEKSIPSPISAPSYSTRILART